MDENVMMLYVEDANGISVRGFVASQIRKLAWSIWVGFYERGMAPKSWGYASKVVKDEYIREMEKKWPVLRYCENNWKSDAITTTFYPPWYRGYSSKEEPKDDRRSCDGPTAKKRRTTTEEPNDTSSPPPEMTPFEDITEPGVEPGPSHSATSRLRERPLSLRSPL